MTQVWKCHECNNTTELPIQPHECSACGAINKWECIAGAPKIVGRKNDQDKPDWTLLHYGSMLGMVRVLEFGCKKYDRNNWMHLKQDRVLKAIMRHVNAISDGEMVDSETGLHHIYHVLCEAMFYAYHVQKDNQPGAAR